MCDLEFELSATLTHLHSQIQVLRRVGKLRAIFKKSFMVKVLGHLFQQQTSITHFFFIQPRPIMPKSACLYLHVSLSYYLVKCGFFFYADVGVS